MAALQACQVIGMPECRINLAHVVTYLSEAPKSTRALEGYNRAVELAKQDMTLPAPISLRNAPTRLMKEVTLPPQKLPRVPEGHYVQWVNACMKGFGNAVTSSNFDYAGPLTETVLFANLALRSWYVKDEKGRFPGRKKLLWNAEEMKITNFDEANQFVKRQYRDGYSFNA